MLLRMRPTLELSGPSAVQAGAGMKGRECAPLLEARIGPGAATESENLRPSEAGNVILENCPLAHAWKPILTKPQQSGPASGLISLTKLSRRSPTVDFQVQGGLQVWHGRPAREITRKMRVPHPNRITNVRANAVCESGAGVPPVKSRARCACHTRAATAFADSQIGLFSPSTADFSPRAKWPLSQSHFRDQPVFL